MWPRFGFVVLLVVTSTFARNTGGGAGHGRGHVSGRASHSYPASTGFSGTNTGGAHTYPHSSGLSGNSYSSPRAGSYGHNTEVHNHYHYNPPQQINYGSGTHPVYHEKPPIYVYEYRDSGSKFDTLLTGLALYNLGRMSSNHDHHYDSHREYKATPNEICKLGISKSNGEYEETRIDCKLMSSFIWEVEKEQNKTVTVNTQVSTTVNVTRLNIFKPGTSNATNENNTVVTSTITVQNTTVKDALQVKGPSMTVTPGMTCFMIRISKDTSILKKKVECGLLQAYAQKSLQYNSSDRILPVMIVLLSFLTLFMN